RDGGLRSIGDAMPESDPLSYPIFFPTGTLGWHPNMTTPLRTGKRIRLTQMEYYSYYFQERNSFNPILRGGKLTQQFAVDAFAKVEQNRTSFIFHNQDKLRLDSLRGLTDFMQSDEVIPGGES